ncbi:ELL2 factor, partial [Halcyon senegalensis]|nr:ELL2 factor [Halcyon senegalensis]
CACFSFRKYVPIVSQEQRQSYYSDFSAEFDEYKSLYSRMETVSRTFMRLDAQWKLLSPNSEEYQVKKNNIVKTVCCLSQRAAF